MHSLSKWELDNCPWWIDLDDGEFLESERKDYYALKKVAPNLHEGKTPGQTHGKDIIRGFVLSLVIVKHHGIFFSACLVIWIFLGRHNSSL